MTTKDVQFTDKAEPDYLQTEGICPRVYQDS